MKIPFLDQAMNWWFADRYPRCDLPDGTVGTRFIFFRTNKLLKNRRVFFCCCGNRSAASLRRSVVPISLIFLIKLWTDMREHSELGCSFQLLYEFQPLSLKSFSMTFSKTSNFNRLWFALQWFLHCHDLFARERRKKTN